MSLSISGLLIDIDGTVLDSGDVIDGAPEAISWLRENGFPFRFATNITRKTRRALAHDLETAGIVCTPHEILTATSAAVNWLHAHEATRIELLLPASAREEFDGFQLGTPNPEYVVVGDLGLHWDFSILNRAFRFLMEGAQLLAVQKNRYWNDSGGLALDCGAFVVALEYATGMSATVAGKPSAAFFESASNDLGLPKDQIAMIGDDLGADVRGARAAGLHGILVRTGKYRTDDEDEAQREATAVIDSLGDVPDLIRH